jgi:hypothetical protein
MKQNFQKVLKQAFGSRVPLAVFSAAAVLAPSAFAAPIVGTLALSANGTTVIAVNGTKIDFNFTGTVSNTFPPVATSGTVTGNNADALYDVGASSTGSFAPLVGTTTIVHDLDSTLEPTGSFVGASLPLSHFISFTAQPLWDITLTEVLPGVFGGGGCTGPTSALVGTTCSLPGSPFNLTNLGGNQVSAAFSYIGRASDGAGNFTNISGSFQTTFSNTTIQGIVAALAAGQAVVTTGSGTLAATAAPVPEPGSTSMAAIGGALLMLSAAVRRRLRQ